MPTYHQTFPISSMETIIRDTAHQENQQINNTIKLEFRQIGPTTRMLTTSIPYKTPTNNSPKPTQNKINLYHISFHTNHITIIERLNDRPKRYTLNHNDPNLLPELKNHIQRILKNHIQPPKWKQWKLPNFLRGNK